MIHLTADATAHLNQLRETSGMGAGTGIRFMRAKTPTGLAVVFSRRPELGDTTIRRPGLSVYVANDIARHLDAEIDVAEVDGVDCLVIRPAGPANGTPAIH